MHRLFPSMIVCLILAGCSQAKVDKPVPASIAKNYAHRLREVLPAEWSMGWYENTLWIRRVGMVTVATILPNAPGPTTEPASTEPAATAPVTLMPLSNWTRQLPFVFTLTFSMALKPVEYQRRVESNARREAQLEEYREQLRGVTHKFDDYSPATPQEKKLVAQYRQAEKKLPYYDLPTLFAKDCSARITDSVAADMGGNSLMVDPDVAAECQQVRLIIEGFFAKSPDDLVTPGK